MTAVSQEEIDKLFSALIAEYLPPVTEIRPNEIEKLEEFEKEIYKKQFNVLLQIYVKPLEILVSNLLDSTNNEKYAYDVANLSILDRVTLFSDILTQSGYTPEQLASLVPKTEKEVDLLAAAINKGFDDSIILDNKTRVAEAQKFLNSLEEVENVGRKIA